MIDNPGENKRIGKDRHARNRFHELRDGAAVIKQQRPCREAAKLPSAAAFNDPRAPAFIVIGASSVCPLLWLKDRYSEPLS
jgi:hypothetical protein